MKLKSNLFDLTDSQESMSKMFYDGKVIKCLVAPYHNSQSIEIDYSPNVMLFPENELSLIFFEADLRDSITMGRGSIRYNEIKYGQLKNFISMCVNSQLNEVLIITSSLDIILNMIDDCVRVLTEYDEIVDCPVKTFAANPHTIKYEVLDNKKHQKSEEDKQIFKTEINKVIELLNNNNSLSNEERQYCEKIIDSVGEPIISNKLRNMLRDF